MASRSSIATAFEKVPSSAPSSYSTLRGLLRAVERVCRLRADRVAGMSRGMWLHNAEFYARATFTDATSVPELRNRYAVTRPQDLKGGHSVFGIPLPTRAYGIGDVVPGVGRIDDEVATTSGRQFRIAGTWYHERGLG